MNKLKQWWDQDERDPEMLDYVFTIILILVAFGAGYWVGVWFL